MQTPKNRLRAAIEHERRLLRTSACDKLLEVVTSPRIDALVAEYCGSHRTRLFPPAVPLGLFVEQTINMDSACQDVEVRYLSQRTVLGLAPGGLGTSSYCKARLRLPASMIEASVREVATIAATALPVNTRRLPKKLRPLAGP